MYIQQHSSPLLSPWLFIWDIRKPSLWSLWSTTAARLPACSLLATHQPLWSTQVGFPCKRAALVTNANWGYCGNMPTSFNQHSCRSTDNQHTMQIQILMIFNQKFAFWKSVPGCISPPSLLRSEEPPKSCEPTEIWGNTPKFHMCWTDIKEEGFAVTTAWHGIHVQVTRGLYKVLKSDPCSHRIVFFAFPLDNIFPLKLNALHLCISSLCGLIAGYFKNQLLVNLGCLLPSKPLG